MVITIPVLQMTKQRLREVKSLVKDHTADQQQSWDLILCRLALEPTIL